jgi:hypothetical protein
MFLSRGSLRRHGASPALVGGIQDVKARARGPVEGNTIAAA